MKSRTANCPACGGPVEFKVSSSLVTVCGFCNSAVARSDRKVEDQGKIADLVDTGSPLAVGATGKFGKKHFTIVGRVQYAHPAGGVWNEWYLSFPGDRWGWLSEAQGKYHLMFQRRIPSSLSLPARDELSVGATVKLGKHEFTTVEIGEATCASAEGEIPWGFTPGAPHDFVDLHGADDVLATLEYGESPSLFVGKEIQLPALNIEEVQWAITNEPTLAALQLNCPHCAGALTLHAPDKAERVVCHYCSSVLDASQGNLTYLKTLQHQERFNLRIPLGTEGKLFGKKYTVIGWMRRVVKYEGTSYPWTEYLLYNDDIGFRWLVHSDYHWSFVEPVSAAKVARSHDSVTYEGQRFRLYDRSTAVVRNVLGEFYWRVEVGERVRAEDYIAPPRMISIEKSKTDRSEEVNYSVGQYLEVQQVEEAFGLQELNRPWSVGVIQPSPTVGAAPFLMWPIFLFVLVVIRAAFSASDTGLMIFGMILVSLFPVGILLYRYSFEVRRWQDSDYSPYSSD